jgi:hypothetical protein
MVERFFRDLTVNRLQRGVFHSVPALIEALESYVHNHNAAHKPFMWTATVKAITPVTQLLPPSGLRRFSFWPASLLSRDAKRHQAQRRPTRPLPVFQQALHCPSRSKTFGAANGSRVARPLPLGFSGLEQRT